MGWKIVPLTNFKLRKRELSSTHHPVAVYETGCVRLRIISGLTTLLLVTGLCQVEITQAFDILEQCTMQRIPSGFSGIS